MGCSMVRNKIMNYWEINKKLSNPRNWNKELLYVHKTRLILGFILGLSVGAFLTLIISEIIK